MLNHVLPELPGRPDDAHLLRSRRTLRSEVAVTWPRVEAFVVGIQRFFPGHRFLLMNYTEIGYFDRFQDSNQVV
jgi:hypothetical protein